MTMPLLEKIDGWLEQALYYAAAILLIIIAGTVFYAVTLRYVFNDDRQNFIATAPQNGKSFCKHCKTRKKPCHLIEWESDEHHGTYFRHRRRQR